MNTKLRTLSISLACIFLSLPAIALQSPPPPTDVDENMERITVYGQKSIRELNKEIQKMTKSFFQDYNKINKNNQYVVICKKESRANTNLKAQNCEPRYVKSHRNQEIATRVFGNDAGTLGDGFSGSAILTRLVNLNGINRVPPAQNKKFHDHIAKLLKENPHLIEQYEKIVDLQREYAYKKANR